MCPHHGAISELTTSPLITVIPQEQLSSIASSIDQIATDVSRLKAVEVENKLDRLEKRLREVEDKVGEAKSTASGIGSNVFFATLVISFLIALTSNPPKTDHLANFTNRLTDGDVTYAAIRKQFPGLEPFALQNVVKYESYWCCSVAKLVVGEHQIPISLGVFGNVVDLATLAEVEKKFGSK